MDLQNYLNNMGAVQQTGGSMLGYPGLQYDSGPTANISGIQWADQQPQQQLQVVDTSAADAAKRAQNASFINQSYDTRLAGLQGVFDTLNPQQDAAVLNVNNQWQNQRNSLDQQKALGQRNLNAAGQQVNENKARSISDLTRQVQTMGRNYQNQLGAYGAGDSSANDMLNQALSGMASRNRSNVMYDAANQQRGIDLQGQDLQLEYDNNLKSLDDWKSTSLNDIASKFLQQRQSIQQQMQTANADRYAALAAEDQSYVQQAIAALAQLENQYRQNSQDLIQQYQTLSSPQYSLSPQLQQYAAKPIDPGKIQQLQLVPGVSNGSNPTPAAQRRPFQQDYGF